jgi:flagellar biosynthetic protein FliQ
MDEMMVLDIGRDAMFMILRLTGPLMVVGTVVGVVLAFVQALTTIQETTLTFVPKIVAMLVAAALTMPMMLTTLIDFTRELFEHIATGG